MPGVPPKLAGGGLGPTVADERTPCCVLPAETWIAGLTVTAFCDPVWTAAEGGCGCGVAGESNDPTATLGGCCKPTRSLRTAAEMSDRSCVICVSVKAVAGTGVWSTLTDSGAGVALLGPARSKGTTTGGVACSKAWIRSASRAFEPVVMRLRAEANSTKLWRGRAKSCTISMDAGCTGLERRRRFLVGRGILNQNIACVLFIQRLAYGNYTHESAVLET